MLIAACGSSKKSEEGKGSASAAPATETAEATAKAFAAAVHAHDLAGIEQTFATPELLAASFDCPTDHEGVVYRAKTAREHMEADPHAMDGVEIDIEVHMKDARTLAKDEAWADCKAKAPVAIQTVELSEHVVEKGAKPEDSKDVFTAVQLGGRWYLVTDSGS
ncbi:MAG TPA: hypothetical protein VL463_01725 [Kofleriaceae bacterium]|nr:hypothetical protein [Kofleriaceae bacterium]